MFTIKPTSAVAGIPAAFVAVPAPVSALVDSAHRNRTANTGMADAVFGQARHPRGIPL